jgi:hypothetical protein
MAADHGFFARWSRRKHAQLRRKAMASPLKADTALAATVAADAPAKANEAPLPTANKGLPSMDLTELGALRAALASGTLAEATRVALRQVWSSDPVIRDFIGLSENSWDFTAPGAMPGFGPLSSAQAQQLLARMSNVLQGNAPESMPKPPPEPAQRRQAIETPAVMAPPADSLRSRAQDESTNHSALQQDGPEPGSQLIDSPRHGSALPK